MMTLRAGRRITARRLFTMAPLPVLRKVRAWYFKRIEQHCLISAEVEMNRASEAMRNASWYQKQAALARSAQGQ